MNAGTASLLRYALSGSKEGPNRLGQPEPSWRDGEGVASDDEREGPGSIAF